MTAHYSTWLHAGGGIQRLLFNTVIGLYWKEFQKQQCADLENEVAIIRGWGGETLPLRNKLSHVFL